MTQTGSSNAIVNAMLGWLKGLANWVLRLFNLSGGFSPLRFLADNWLKLLILLLIVGMAADLLIWLIRWRPHWVWFHKKRVIINDKNFFAAENEVEPENEWEPVRGREPRRRQNWRDEDFVVAGAARRRREERAREEARERRAREEREKALRAAEPQPMEIADDVFTDGMFNVDAKQRFSDRYEDEVFSVIDLPEPELDREPRRERSSRERKGSSRNVRSAPRGQGRTDAARRRASDNRRR